MKKSNNCIYRSVAGIIEQIPVCEKSQEPLINQMAYLREIASRLGMQEASDAIDHIFKIGQLSKIRYGCHADLCEGEEPDECVIDQGRRKDCVYAQGGIRKEQCEYWRIVVDQK